MTIDMFWYGEEEGFGKGISSPKDIEIWEPRNYKEWLYRDKLIRLLRHNQKVDVINIEELAISIFDAWSRMPSPIRRQFWREREIAAELYEMSIHREWSEIPNFLCTGVGQREVDKHLQLVGIINFRSLGKLTRKDLDVLYHLFRIPRILKVPSIIKPFNPNEEVPIILEESPSLESFTNHTSQNNSSVIHDSFPQVQSGDVIHCKDIDGTSTTPGTLTTIVVSRENSSSITKHKILTVDHVLNEYHPLVFTHKSDTYVKVGQLYNYNSSLIHSLASKLDAAIADLDNNCHINPKVKWADLIPAPPIMPWNGMPVQMYGGKSRHQKGYINQCNCLPSGGTPQGIIPHFSVDISAIPGDSGSLLVSGHEEHHVFSEIMASSMAREYLNSSRCAMLGMLLAGPSSPTRSQQVYFRPVTEIFHYLKVIPWVRKTF